MTVTQLRDQELVRQFVSGDQTAIEHLISRHKSRVFTYIMLIVKDEQLAEDIFQDTFIKVIKSLQMGKYKEKGTFVSWVIRIAHNLIMDNFRKSKHLKTYNGIENDTNVFNSTKFSEETMEQVIIRDQIAKDIRTLLGELPEEQCEVILLRHYGNLSFREIAEQTDVNICTALGRMRYGLIGLRRLIEQKNLSLKVL